MPSPLDVLRSSNSFEEIIGRIAVALVILDKGNRIIFANPHAETLFGYTASEMLDHRVDLLVPEGHMDGDPQGAGFECEPIGRSKDGARIPLKVTVESLRSVSGVFSIATIVDSSARKRADAVEQQMAAIIESAEDAILTKNLDGIIQSWNPGAERLLGYRAEEVIGEPITRLIPLPLQDEECMILNQIRKGQRVQHFETIRRRRDGSEIPVSLTISPIRDRSGAIVGASKIMRDISRRKEVEDTLRRNNVELERINAELDAFVYTASHDLRSPLTNIASVAQWILDDDDFLSAQSRDRLLLIQDRIERMKRLLTDIRDYARTGSTEETAGAPLSAALLLADVIESLHIPAGFFVKLDATLERVQVTRNPLAQVFHNLIDNAIKHHDEPRGSVEVSVASSGAMWRFSVRDDGPGIPEEYREEIFGMFKTLKPRDEMEGSGMGLALVKKIVSRMGGACGVESAPARGAEFWFTWPNSLQQTVATL